MPGAKGHCRFDQQRFGPFGDFIGVMAAIDKEPTSRHRGQFALYLGDPIGFRQFRHGKGFRPIGHRQQRQTGLIGCFGEIATDLPQARTVLDLEHANAGGFRDQIFHRQPQRLGRVFSGKGGQGGKGGHGALRG